MSHNKIHTDTDVRPFEKVTQPEVGQYYHLAWAFKGCKFKLTGIYEDGILSQQNMCEVWTGRTKNKYLRVKLADLRQLRSDNISSYLKINQT